jgi:hypothetical protein
MRKSSEPSTQPHSIFKAFEHKAWQTVVDQYDAAFSRLTQPAIPSVFEALDVRPCVRLLDAACGPGNLAAAALRLRQRTADGDTRSCLLSRKCAPQGRQGVAADAGKPRLGHEAVKKFPSACADGTIE